MASSPFCSQDKIHLPEYYKSQYHQHSRILPCQPSFRPLTIVWCLKEVEFVSVSEPTHWLLLPLKPLFRVLADTWHPCLLPSSLVVLGSSFFLGFQHHLLNTSSEIATLNSINPTVQLVCSFKNTCYNTKLFICIFMSHEIPRKIKVGIINLFHK